MRRPGKIVCVGHNYRAHIAEIGAALPAEPLLFGKFANTVIGPGEPIVLPREATHVDAEAELAVVIGRTVRRVSPERALDAVAGYLCANDVSASTRSAPSGPATSRCPSRRSATAPGCASCSG
jgi:acylpyruvate hydrolase